MPAAEAESLARASHLHSLLMQAPSPIAVLHGPTHVFDVVNAQYQRLVDGRAVIGRTVADCLPEVVEQGFIALLDRVYATGERFEGRETKVRLRTANGTEDDHYLDFVYEPMRGAGGAVEGIMVFAHDVTAQTAARKQQSETAQVLKDRQAELALGAEVGVAFTGSLSLREMLQRSVEAVVRHLDAAFARIWTTDRTGTVLQLQASAGMYTHINGPHANVPVGKFKIGLIAQEVQPHLTNDVQNDPRVGDREWAKREGMVSFAGYPLVVEGRVIGVMAMFARQRLAEQTLSALGSIADSLAVGIERKRAEARAREESETLEVLNRVGQTIAGELDHDKVVDAVTQSATRLTGAEFGAFFYNVVDERGEAYTLYSIAGVAREEFSKFPMPRNTKVFAPTFAGEGVVRVDDITKDPRYGQNAPHHGMPKGHLPVVSYLAVPVVSRSGEVIGGLFFGHKKPAQFDERAERLARGVAAMAAIAMDNARLFREAQKLIRALEQTNKELDQFAYVASHDLKAPLRGIANLSQWLEEDLASALNDGARKQLELLRGRVHRMESLIEGILQYSRAGRMRGSRRMFDVHELVAETIELIAPRPPMQVRVEGELPQVFGEKVPLQQVLMNLINNALKHGGRPDITVTVRSEADGASKEFLRFTVEDDGRGIAPQYHERIWGIFQTLEARDKVESTGIGLAIVKKIVESRNGRVWVESDEGRGARFHFTWPRREAAAP